MTNTRQNGLAPYGFTCLDCGATWLPDPVTRGPTKGQHTDSSLEKSARAHTCPPVDNNTKGASA